MSPAVKESLYVTMRGRLTRWEHLKIALGLLAEPDPATRVAPTLIIIDGKRVALGQIEVEVIIDPVNAPITVRYYGEMRRRPDGTLRGPNVLLPGDRYELTNPKETT